MPALKVVVLALVLASCASEAAPTTTSDPLSAAAREYAASADRAVETTAYADLSVGEVGDALVRLCGSEGPVQSAVASEIDGFGIDANSADTAVMAEVLLSGIDAVCPARVVGDVALFLRGVDASVTAHEGIELDDAVLTGGGVAACGALAVGTPAAALVVVATDLYGVEESLERLLAGAITAPQTVTAGAVLGSAVTYLCPAYRTAVEEFLNSLVDGG